MYTVYTVEGDVFCHFVVFFFVIKIHKNSISTNDIMQTENCWLCYSVLQTLHYHRQPMIIIVVSLLKILIIYCAGLF